MVRGEVMRAYRDLIRPIRYSFAGNTMMLRESVEEIRKRFIKNRHVNSNNEIQKLLECAHLFSLLIRSLIAKAELNQRGGLEFEIEGGKRDRRLPKNAYKKA
ncbi:hypothetical protein Pint_16428 [Pistacia integerrima]|uniref:Uncharacterized protein n=1 Tax=Pistacia integerrima TaxID=434235 RepID=A0ACC0ZBW5_9ROSI|nr:hypothetical protein Pint_16428 [Pistacia integerrima]